jgi:tetratricopeptide (TPR) repeat protein
MKPLFPILSVKTLVLPVLRNLILVLMLAGAWAAPCQAQPQARAFIAGLEAYKGGDFGQAIRQWQALADAGITNGKLYYNLGNAYLKNDDLGRALLWYERALILLPNDPDLRFNYDYARSLTRDAQDEGPAAWMRILFFWKYQLSPGAIKGLALVFNLLFWSLLAAFRLTRRRGLRHAAWAAGLPALVFILTAAFAFMTGLSHQPAVILPEQVPVRSGLDSASTELFTLHAGARVAIVKTLKDHYQIRFSDDKIGWVPKDASGLVQEK